MIDSGCTPDWRPSDYIRGTLKRTNVDYLFITNADQDHMSDLAGLRRAGISVETLIRNPHPPADALRSIKQAGGTPTDDIDEFLSMHGRYTAPVALPFNEGMGGITATYYFNRYPEFKTTNDLSLVVFLKYCGFSILFPGDLEVAGWRALLERPAFRADLGDVDVLVASHHGRENGYCAELFDYCSPRAIVMSDKAIHHDTQRMTQTYRQRVIDRHPAGVYVATTGKRRHVLTTRRDGWIQFDVDSAGAFTISTEYNG
ncbi:ComEC/Rec2 family competence protein [Bordetella sp. H567]|uniref:ComEC/Rec2 family competence protein n=1 Tax=Bordetella sp. H567 TaxID=1697043 RepID=UPI001F3E8C49|nr:hypothetical protein [Bordetella sp. H567]